MGTGGKNFGLTAVSDGRIYANIWQNNGFVMQMFGWAKPIHAWHHVAVTRDNASVWSLFIDGAKTATETAAYNMDGLTHAITLSPRAGGNINYFYGGMDEVRLFNRQLADAEVRSLYAGTFDSGTLLTLPLDDALAINGSTLADASGARRDATLQTGDAANKATTSKIGSNALQLDGVDDYAGVASSRRTHPPTRRRTHPLTRRQTRRPERPRRRTHQRKRQPIPQLTPRRLRPPCRRTAATPSSRMARPACRSLT